MPVLSSGTISPVCLDEWKENIESRHAQVGIIGLGYVGLPLALLFAAERFPVTGFDVDHGKVDRLSAGESHIGRIKPWEIEKARTNGFRATVDYSHIREMDAVIVCVPTPLGEFREPELRYIRETAQCIAKHLQPRQLIVLESTTYPGTTEDVLVPILEKQNPEGLCVARSGRDNESAFYVAFSPEREDPGNMDFVRQDVPKVIGGVDAVATELASELYRTVFRETVHVSSPAAAEMTKLLENIYRCVNIALVNELKLLCLRMGIDIWEVIEAAKTKPFGFQAFYPGPGLGGHCIPVDPFYLSWKAKEFDFHTRFIELAGEINTSMPYHIVAAVISALNARKKALQGARVLVLGLSYKKDIDDLRESPSIRIIELLRKAGADVSYHDPYFPYVGRGRKYELHMKCAPLEDLGRYDCVLIATDHSGYDYVRIVEESQLVIDTRNATRKISSRKIVHC